MIISRLVQRPHSLSNPCRPLAFMSEVRGTVVRTRQRSPESDASIHSGSKRRKLKLPIAACATGQQPVKQVNKRPPANKPATGGLIDPNPDAPWLIVGLGNPGGNYENTRHNIGFMLIDELARMESIDCRKLEKSAAVGRGEMCGKKVILAKPVTFMNNSGESVSALAKFYKVPLNHVLVISDDLDQPTATIRLRAKGGHGGHNGLRSIMARMGNSQDFPRIKIGIGRPSGPTPIAT
eukprot:gene10254-8172_t